jgi:ABC-type glycerol-3-phosphate transport system substrate-binding protein
MLPSPTGPAGPVDQVGTGEWMLFKHNPYPELAKGFVQYSMEPEQLRKVMEEGGGRWGTPYQGMYSDDFWQRPAFQHWRAMLGHGRQFASPGSQSAAAGEVLATNVLSRMVQRVLVENLEPEKAVEDAHKKVVDIYARYSEG